MNDLSRSLVRVLVVATGEQELTAREEDIAAWVLIVGSVPLVIQVCIKLLIISGVTKHSPFTEDVYFYSRAIVGSGLLGFGLTMAARKASRFVVRMCLLLAAVYLFSLLLATLTKFSCLSCAEPI